MVGKGPLRGFQFLLVVISTFSCIVGTNVGDISIWEVGSRERLVHKSFKVWDISACSMPFQVRISSGFWILILLLWPLHAHTPPQKKNNETIKIVKFGEEMKMVFGNWSCISTWIQIGVVFEFLSDLEQKLWKQLFEVSRIPEVPKSSSWIPENCSNSVS